MKPKLVLGSAFVALVAAVWGTWLELGEDSRPEAPPTTASGVRRSGSRQTSENPPTRPMRWPPPERLLSQAESTGSDGSEKSLGNEPIAGAVPQWEPPLIRRRDPGQGTATLSKSSRLSDRASGGSPQAAADMTRGEGLRSNEPIALWPALWADLGDGSDLTESQQAELQQDAELLQQRLADSGLAIDSAAYRALWESEVEDSDRIFRQRYGVHAWHRHHVQAYHLGGGTAATAR